MTEVQAIVVTPVVAVTDKNTPARVNFREHDLVIVNQWVRQELFKKVKFLYTPDTDLIIGGKIFKSFEKYCSTKLIGLQVNNGMSQTYVDLYLQSIWSEATQAKKNLIMDGLNARRSCVYSAMQNRFNGKHLQNILLHHSANSHKHCC